MSIRYKLLLPLFVSFLCYIGLILFYWMPGEMEKSKQAFIDNQKSILLALEPDLLRNVLAGDFAALYNTVHQQEELHQAYWNQISIYDENNQKIYPLFHLAQKSPTQDSPYLLEITHPVYVDETLQASVKLQLNWEPLRDQSIESSLSLAFDLLVIFFMFLGAAFFIQEKFVRRPLNALTKSADSIAQGNFKVGLPKPTNDEIGNLTRSFETMRDNLEASNSNLLSALAKTESAERFQRCVFNNMAEGLMSADHEGNILNANPAIESIFGYSANALKGQNISILIPHSRKQRHQQLIKKTAKSPHQSGDIMGAVRVVDGVRKDGEIIQLDVTVTEMETDDGVIYNAILRDVTERIKTEQALLQAKKDAEQASRAKSRFLAAMSHEIRTPMNGVLGMLQLIQDSRLTAQQRELVNVANSSGEMLLTVINDILDFSKMEADRLVLESIPFNLTQVVEETSQLLYKAAFDKGLEIICSVDPTIPEMVKGDPTRLRQILTNLIGNAVKFTDRGEIVVSLSRQSPKYCISVRDTGIGIEAEQMDKLFQSFTQVDDSHARKYGGTGLGLVISQRLVQAMGSEIEVTSEQGKGSEFRFSIELEEIDKTRIPPDLSDQWQDARVLVVDDNQTNRMVVKKMLESWHIEHISLAEDAKQALDLIRDADHDDSAFKLILLDQNMPGMTGIELAEAIRQQFPGSGTRLVMLTSAPIEPSWHVDLQLNKPVRHSDLYNALRGITTTEPQETIPAIAETTPIPKKPSSGSRQILLVEDNDINRMVAKKMLTKLGYQPDIAENGRIALDMIEDSQYGLILMDIQMPIMDGLTATRKIRSLGHRLQTLPIIAMTANVLEEDIQAALNAGMNGHLGKPIELQQLDETLKRYLGDTPREVTT